MEFFKNAISISPIVGFSIVPILAFSVYVAFIYALVHGFRGLLLSLLQVGVIALLVMTLFPLLPEKLQIFSATDRPIAYRFLVAFLVVHWAVFAPRFLLGIGARLRAPAAGATQGDGIPLLPSQAEVVARLFTNCGGVPFERGAPGARAQPRMPAEGRLVTIEAGWGRGKTFVLRRFQELARPVHRGVLMSWIAESWAKGKSVLLCDDGSQSPPSEAAKARDAAQPHDYKLVVSYYNAWTNQAERDPEFAIVEHLLGDAAVMWPYGWIVVPAYRVFFHALGNRVFGGRSFSLDATWLKMEGGGGAPSVPVKWSEFIARLAQVTHRCSWKRSGATLVLIVDDVDRCAPVVAQRYVTLFRRGLNQPHLSIVFPYARDQLRYKVFDPISVDLPDLGSSMEAALVAYLESGRAPFKPQAIGGPAFMRDNLSAGFLALYSKRVDGAVTGKEHPSKEEKSNCGDASWADALNRWELLRRELLNLSYSELGAAAPKSAGGSKMAAPSPMELFLRQLESKYVSDAPILLGRLSYADAVQIMIDLPMVQETLFGRDRADPEYRALHEALSELAQSSLPQGGQGSGEPTLQKSERDEVIAKLREESFDRRTQTVAELMRDVPLSIRALVAAVNRVLQRPGIFPVPSPIFGRGETFDMNRLNEIIAALDLIYVMSHGYMIESEDDDV